MAQQNDSKPIKTEEIEVKKTKKNRRLVLKTKVPSLLRPSCLKVFTAGESPAIAGDSAGHVAPTHLVVTVNGIIGSADDWRFAAKQFMKKYPQDIIVLCSGCNNAIRTFHGIDVMGKRLADEVMSFVKTRPELQKISFVAHSLGGLVARYAIALLFNNNNNNSSNSNSNSNSNNNNSNSSNNNNNNKIAGLEPINFITFATPHLGCRSHKQLPIFRGVHMLEKFAYKISWIAGKTGNHLFLKDGKNGKPPLLLQMAHDTGDLQFFSALKSFKRHVAYSNYCFDFIVGRKTSAIRRQNELPKKKDFVKNDKYPHIVYEEKPNLIEDEFSENMIFDAKTTDEMEDVMIRGLNRIPWERVHVSFRKSRQKIFAHSTIHVKTYFLNSDGKDVVFHMLDHFLL